MVLISALQQLNALTPEQAKAEFLKCCGSRAWANAMSDARPFIEVGALFHKADSIWWSLSEQDWLEACHAHPKIGEQKAATAQTEQARNWSAQEQSGVHDSAIRTREALAAGNQEYEQRFGFIFIVCATGKTSEEMLATLNERLRNDRGTELRRAAEEQLKITRLRLEKLLNQ
jgi:OHCU decarboxylase